MYRDSDQFNFLFVLEMNENHQPIGKNLRVDSGFVLVYSSGLRFQKLTLFGSVIKVIINFI